jgi:hypothetical protein
MYLSSRGNYTIYFIVVIEYFWWKRYHISKVLTGLNFPQWATFLVNVVVKGSASGMVGCNIKILVAQSAEVYAW